MRQDKNNTQTASDFDEEKRELQDLVKTLKSSEERANMLSRRSEDIEKMMQELKEIGEDPERKAAFEHLLATTSIDDLMSEQNT
jgi:type VI protein secretion system component VasF